MQEQAPGEHRPVMVKEVLAYLACTPGQTVVDATLGSGGHAGAILDCISPGGLPAEASAKAGWLIGIDRDPEAIERAKARLAGRGRVTLVDDNYARLEVILDKLGVDAVDGVLIDCGASMEQLTTARRGFSFRLEGPLDMRMDPREHTTAADLVNRLPEEELARILWEYGGNGGHEKSHKQSPPHDSSNGSRRQHNLQPSSQQLSQHGRDRNAFTQPRSRLWP